MLANQIRTHFLSKFCLNPNFTISASKTTRRTFSNLPPKDTREALPGRPFRQRKFDEGLVDPNWADYKEKAKLLLSAQSDWKHRYDAESLIKLPRSYEESLERLGGGIGLKAFLQYYSNPLQMLAFAGKYLLSFRFLFIYMARTTFQAVRPLLAFCVFGEIMKLILANISGGVPAFLFSFVLAFEVLYFFLQCYISYTFLMMFFTVMF